MPGNQAQRNQTRIGRGRDCWGSDCSSLTLSTLIDVPALSTFCVTVCCPNPCNANVLV